MVTPVFGQETAEDVPPVPDVSESMPFGDVPTTTYQAPAVRAGRSTDSASVTGFGIDGRVGHIFPDAFGRSNSITPLELFPYYATDESIIFGDVRGFISNDAQLGANIGGGFRHIGLSEQLLLGANAFYDVDNTTGELFHQLGFGLEAWTRWAGLSSNFYFPLGNNDKVFSRTIENERFEGNQILFDVRNTIGRSMRGADATLDVYLPGDFLVDHNARVSGGYYHFEGGDADNIDGFRLAVNGSVYRSIWAELAVTHDNTFDTNVTLGVHWRFGKPFRSNDLEGQLRRFVNRNYNVIVTRESVGGDGVAAINPDTGNAYVVQHVSDTGSAGGAGTADNPFDSVSAAQAAGADVIFVHGDTTLNESIALQEGQYLLGDGSGSQLTDAVFGPVNLPDVVPGGDLPVITSSVGDAVTLANHTHFSGFVIDGGVGNAVTANGIDDFAISNVTIQNVLGDGVVIENSTGAELSDVQVDTVGTTGIRIVDTDGYALNNVAVSNTQGDGVLIQESTDGDIRGLQVSDSGGDAVRLVGIDDELDLRNLAIDGGAGDGVSIEGGHGTTHFLGTLNINDVLGSAFAIDGLETLTETVAGEDVVTKGTVLVDHLVVDAAAGGHGIEITDSEGDISFGPIDITTSGGSGLMIQDSDYVFINGGTIESENAPAADIANSHADVGLTSLSASGGSVGVRIVDSTGAFYVFGSDALGTGGTFENLQSAVYLRNAGQVGFQLVDFTDNSTVFDVVGGSSLEVSYAEITGTSLQILNARNLKVLNFGGATIDDNPLTGGPAIVFSADQAGSYVASVTSNKVTDTDGSFFQAKTFTGAGTPSLKYVFQSNQITQLSDGAIAADLDWSGPVTGTLSSNVVLGSGDNQTAFRFQTAAGADLSTFNVVQNGISFTGENSVGFDYTAASPARYTFTQNEVLLQGTDGIAFRGSTSAASDLTFTSNRVKDYAGGATGFLFPTLANNTRIWFNGNTVDLSAADTFVDRGFIITTTTGTDPIVQLFSTTSNTITGATTFFSAPSGETTGSILINDTAVP